MMMKWRITNLGLGAGEVPAPALGVLVTLFLQTSLWLLVVQTALSQNLGMAWAAVRITAVLWLLTGVVAAIRAWTGSVRVGLIVASVALVSALSLPGLWLWAMMILIVAGWLSRSADGAVLRVWGRLDIWCASAMSAALVLSVTHYADFSVLEKLRQGVLHQDAMFHASIAAMLKTYGVSSAGLHGLVPLPYHVWAHRSLAAISTMASVPVLETFGIANTLVLCPLLVLSVAWAGCAIGGVRREEDALRAWVFATAVLILFKALPLEWWGGWDAYFVSESYTLGLALFVFALPALASRERTPGALFVSGLLFILAGITKVNFGFSGFVLAAAVVALVPSAAGRRRAVLALAVPAAIVIWLMGDIARSSVDATASTWIPFATLQVHAIWGREVGRAIEILRHAGWPGGGVLLKALAAVVMFVVIMLVLSWAVLLRRVRASGVIGAWRCEDGVMNLAAAGIGLGVLVIGPPGDWYFLNQAMFVALPFLVMPAVNWSAGLPLDRHRQWLVALALLTTWMVAVESREPLGGVYLKTRQNVLDQGERGRVNDHVDALLALRGRGLGRNVMFQPDSTFPKPTPGIWNCYQVPFAYPAVTEHAWIGILEPESGCAYRLWGYPSYFAPGSPRSLIAPVLPQGMAGVLVGGLATSKTLVNGDWAELPYSPTQFSGSGGMIWTVEPKDITTFAYTRIGHTMIVAFDLDSTSVSGPASVALQIALPAGAVAARSTFAAFQLRDGGRDGVGMAQVLGGKGVIYLYNGAVAGNWSSATNATRVAGSITLEVR